MSEAIVRLTLLLAALVLAFVWLLWCVVKAIQTIPEPPCPPERLSARYSACNRVMSERVAGCCAP
jgi:hypothetical protein